MDTSNGVLMMLVLACLLASSVETRRLPGKSKARLLSQDQSDWLCMLNAPIPFCLADLARGDVAEFKADNCCKYIRSACKQEIYCYFATVCDDTKPCPGRKSARKGRGKPKCEDNRDDCINFILPPTNSTDVHVPHHPWGLPPLIPEVTRDDYDWV